MTQARRVRLKRNAKLMFWMRAFLNFKILNIAISLFYIHRGLSLSEVFYLGVVWAAAGLLFELPSSYLADRLGRKKTILLGIAFMVAHWMFLIFADGFIQVAAAVALYGVSFACFSGTDEALVYDSKRELGEEGSSLSALGRYQSAQFVFKIVTVLIGAVIARDLAEGQFVILLGIDTAATIVALGFAAALVEPRHFMDVEKMEAGVMRDAVSLLRRAPLFFRAIVGREMVFFSVFVVWVYFQKFFVDLGLTIIVIGVGWSVKHALSYILSRSVGRFVQGTSITSRLNQLTFLEMSLFGLFLFLWFVYRQPMALFATYIVSGVSEALRRPLYSEFFNKRIFSYNRSTTLSLTNLVHNVFEIPILLITGMLVAVNPIFPFVVGFALCAAAFAFFRLPSRV